MVEFADNTLLIDELFQHLRIIVDHSFLAISLCRLDRRTCPVVHDLGILLRIFDPVNTDDDMYLIIAVINHVLQPCKVLHRKLVAEVLLRDQHRELVRLHSADNTVLIISEFHHGCLIHKHPVPHLLTEQIIDELEVLDVRTYHVPANLRLSLQDLLHLLEKIFPVIQPGQPVVGREILLLPKAADLVRPVRQAEGIAECRIPLVLQPLILHVEEPLCLLCAAIFLPLLIIPRNSRVPLSPVPVKLFKNNIFLLVLRFKKLVCLGICINAFPIDVKTDDRALEILHHIDKRVLQQSLRRGVQRTITDTDRQNGIQKQRKVNREIARIAGCIYKKHHRKRNHRVQIHFPVHPRSRRCLDNQNQKDQYRQEIAEAEMPVVQRHKVRAPVKDAGSHMHCLGKPEHMPHLHIEQKGNRISSRTCQNNIPECLRMYLDVRVPAHIVKHADQKPVGADEIESVKKQCPCDLLREKKPDIACHRHNAGNQQPQNCCGVFTFLLHREKAAPHRHSQQNCQNRNTYCSHSLFPPCS